MNILDIVFYAASAIILFSASVSVFSTRTNPAVKSAVACMLSITIIFFLIGCDYIALLHLLIFSIVTSGIIILSINNSGSVENKFILNGSFIAPVIIAVFSALLAGNLLSTKWKEIAPQNPGLSVWEISRLIQTEYFLPMILLAVIIFVGIIGSSYIAKRN